MTTDTKATDAKTKFSEHYTDLRRLLFLEALGGRYAKSIKEARAGMRKAASEYLATDGLRKGVTA